MVGFVEGNGKKTNGKVGERMDREKVINAYECVITRGKSVCECGKCDYHIKDSAVFFCDNQRVLTDTLSLLKEQEEQKQKWLQNIADNQLAFAPSERDNAYCYAKHEGIYDGLQMAYNILTEGR